MDLPFASETFRQTWADFLEHRKTVKAPMSDLAAKRILAKCRSWGEPVAIEALDRSIEAGWKGIFPPRGNNEPQRESYGDGCYERVFR
jgi:hypothetical protein